MKNIAILTIVCGIFGAFSGVLIGKFFEIKPKKETKKQIELDSNLVKSIPSIYKSEIVQKLPDGTNVYEFCHKGETFLYVKEGYLLKTKRECYE